MAWRGLAPTTHFLTTKRHEKARKFTMGCCFAGCDRKRKICFLSAIFSKMRKPFEASNLRNRFKKLLEKTRFWEIVVRKKCMENTAHACSQCHFHDFFS